MLNRKYYKFNSVGNNWFHCSYSVEHPDDNRHCNNNYDCMDNAPCMFDVDDYFANDLELLKKFHTNDLTWAVQNLQSDIKDNSLMAIIIIENNK